MPAQPGQTHGPIPARTQTQEELEGMIDGWYREVDEWTSEYRLLTLSARDQRDARNLAVVSQKRDHNDEPEQLQVEAGNL